MSYNDILQNVYTFSCYFFRSLVTPDVLSIYHIVLYILLIARQFKYIRNESLCIWFENDIRLYLIKAYWA